MAETIPVEVVDLLKLVNNFDVHDAWTIEAFADHSASQYWRGRKVYDFTPKYMGLQSFYYGWAEEMVHQVGRMKDFFILIEIQSRTEGVPGSILIFPRPCDFDDDPDPIVEMRREHDGWRIVT